MNPITIRPAQLEHMQQARIEQYARQIFHEVRVDYVSQTAGVDDASLFVWLTQTILRAQGYGLHYDHDIEAFVSLALAIGPWFDEHPPFKSILTDHAMPDHERMRILLQRADEAHVSAAALIRHPQRPAGSLNALPDL